MGISRALYFDMAKHFLAGRTQINMFYPHVRARIILRTYLNNRYGIRGTAAHLGYSKREVARVVMNYISNQHANQHARGVSTQDVFLRI